MFQNALVAAELSTLVAGISGAVVISVFSTNLADTFIAPRTLPATAIILTEPTMPVTSRQYIPNVDERRQSCPRPEIDAGSAISFKKQKLSPAVNKFSKILEPIKRLSSSISNTKTRMYQKLGIKCLFPRLLRPYEPMFQYFRCKLGLAGDDFMGTPPCNISACLNQKIEETQITRDLGLPNLDFMVQDQVSTMYDCFGDMPKVMYGARIRAKLVDDESCDDPRYKHICQELMENNRVLMEQDCENSG